MRHTFRYTVPTSGPGLRVVLAEDDAHHLIRVVRRGVGDVVEVIDAQGRLWPATIISVRPQVELELGPEPRALAPLLPISLAVGLAEFGRLDTLVEKLTELGVASLVLFASERTRRVPDPQAFASRRLRLMRVAEAAARQSGRGNAVVIAPELASFEAVVRHQDSELTLLVDPRGEGGLGDVVRHSGRARVRVIVGPDAGFSVNEIEQAVGAGITIARMGVGILRTETAGIVAATICAEVLGLLGSPT